MPRLKFRCTDSIRYPDDVSRIKSICKARGYKISKTDAQLAWEEYSDSMAAGWMFLPDDDAIVFQTMIRYCYGYVE